MAELYPDRDDAEALNVFFEQIATAIVGLELETELAGLFNRSIPLPVLNNVALKAMENTCLSLPAKDAAKVFSMTCEMRKIPAQFEDRVAKVYSDLCARITTPTEAEVVAGAIFNVVGCSPKFYCKAYSAGFSLHRFDSFYLLVPIKEGIQDTPETNCMLIGGAVAFMAERDVRFNDAFRSWVSRVRWGREVLDKVPHSMSATLRQTFADLFRESAVENPLERPARQGGFTPLTFQDMVQKSLDRMPKRPPTHGA